MVIPNLGKFNSIWDFVVGKFLNYWIFIFAEAPDFKKAIFSAMPAPLLSDKSKSFRSFQRLAVEIFQTFNRLVLRRLCQTAIQNV